MSEKVIDINEFKNKKDDKFVLKNTTKYQEP